MSDEVVFKPGREFSAIHIGLDLTLTAMDRADEAMNVWNRLNDAYPEPEYEGPVKASVGETGNGRPAASRGSGEHAVAWPPTVVRAVDEAGTATVGCSYHKASAANGGGPRPMKDFGANGFKCTAKSARDGNDNGYCPLVYTPEAPVAQPAPARRQPAPAADVPPPIDDDDELPF